MGFVMKILLLYLYIQRLNKAADFTLAQPARAIHEQICLRLLTNRAENLVRGGENWYSIPIKEPGTPRGGRAAALP